MTRTVEMVEVGPRDGLQNEATLVSTANKVALIERAIEVGSRRIEVASFVHPKRVPQMADAEDVIARLPDRKDVTYIGLCLNKRSVLRALATRDGGQRGRACACCQLSSVDGDRRPPDVTRPGQGTEETRGLLTHARLPP